MSLDLWLAYAVATSILLVIPGPTILTVISYSIAHGSAVRLPLIFAVALGDSTALALSLIGLGTLLAQSVFLFQLIKWAGGIYLIMLGIRLLWSGVKLSDLQQNAKKAPGLKAFINTYLVTALNPKGIIFFIAFLPQFISPDHALVVQLWILSATFVGLAAINASLYVIFADRARRWLSSQSTQKMFSVSGGALLTIAGVWALSAEPLTTPAE